jgi:hypothetical protein
VKEDYRDVYAALNQHCDVIHMPGARV